MVEDKEDMENKLFDDQERLVCPECGNMYNHINGSHTDRDGSFYIDYQCEDGHTWELILQKWHGTTSLAYRVIFGEEFVKGS